MGGSNAHAHSTAPPGPPARASKVNIALEILYSRTRRKLLQGTAAGLATSLLAENALPQLLRPPPAHAAANVKQQVPLDSNAAYFDLGLSDYHKAPGSKRVLPEGLIEKSPAGRLSEIQQLFSIFSY